MRFRKFTPIDREHEILELLDENGVVLLDISLANNETVEIAFHQGIANRVLEWDELKRLLSDGVAKVSQG